jgi:putative sigma-54 modulation protein
VFEQPGSGLKVRITSRHENLSPALREDIELKVARISRFLSQFNEAHIILNYEKKSHVCEANLKGKGIQLASRGASHDMYQSIEACFVKLGRQAAKLKDRLTDHKGNRPRNVESIRHGLIAPPDDGQDVEVIRSRKHAVKPMPVEEAALQLTSSKDEFLVFFNAETGRTNVVYKRRDQHIGLIEPEY